MPDVLDGPFQHPVGGPHGLAGEDGRGAVPDGGERARHIGSVLAQQLRLDVAQPDPGAGTGHVQSRLPCPQPGIAYEEQQGPRPCEAPGVGGHEKQPGAVPVEHLAGLAVQPPGPADPPGLDAARTPPPAQSPRLPPTRARAVARAVPGTARAAVSSPEAMRGSSSARWSSVPSASSSGAARTAVDSSGGGRAAADLLAREGQFGDGAADAAVALGKRQTGQTELLGERGPESGVVPGVGTDGARTSSGPQRAASTSRTVRRISSCSAVKRASMGRPSLI